jgi:RNA polymerase sigma-70 factor (ECF subfamily)
MDAEVRFRALFRTAYPALIRFARHRGLNESGADDLVAGTLEIAWRRLEEVPADNPLPWLYGVARNIWRNQLRSETRQNLLVLKLPTSEVQAGPDISPTLDAVALRKSLGELNEDDQEILRLVAWDGLSPSEAAQVLGCSQVAARTRLHRARNRLALELGLDPRSHASMHTEQKAERRAEQNVETEVCDD